MAHARPEYAIVFSVILVLVAVGIPALRRGQTIVGGLCVAAAAGVAVWVLVTAWRERH